MFEEQCCGAPCIINASGGFNVVYCGENHGHHGPHSRKLAGYAESPPAVVSWEYTGVISNPDISPAPSQGGDRCDVQVRLNGFSGISGNIKAGHEVKSLFHLRGSEHAGFCCQQHSNHMLPKMHSREGVDPFGAKWKIEWE